MQYWLIGVLAVAGLLLLSFRRRLRRFYREITAERAHELFLLQREFLEAKFVELARSVEGPAGVRLSDCEFESEALFARQRTTGQLVAFVEMTAHFEPIDRAIEDTDVVGGHRQGTAIFHYHHGQWGTSGRSLFDMSPTESLAHFSHDYEPIPFPPIEW